MLTGKIRTLFRERGYGFVVGKDRVDEFLHIGVIGEEVFGQLREFDEVEFEGDAENRKGPRITKLALVPVPTALRWVSAFRRGVGLRSVPAADPALASATAAVTPRPGARRLPDGALGSADSGLVVAGCGRCTSDGTVAAY